MNDQLSEPEQQGPAEPAGRRSLSFYLALVAIVISLVGTVVSIVEARAVLAQQQIMMDEKAASVWPYVTESNLITQEESSLKLEFSVRNDGVGPALLSRITYLYGNEPITVPALIDTIKAQRTAGIDRVIPLLSANWDRKVIAAGHTETFLRIFVQGPEADYRLGNDAMQNLSLAYCYCSIYNECWTNEAGQPAKTEACVNGFLLK